MEEEGGSFAWKLDKRRAEGCKYVVCVRNRHNRKHPSEGNEPHRHAFLVAENQGLEPWDGRWLIRFGRVAAVDQYVDWQWRDKVYTNLSSLGLSQRQVARKLIDVGSQVSSGRSGHSVDPRHAPIVTALQRELRKLNWKLAIGSTAMRPDLVMQRDGLTVMFEVKPDNSQASFFAGLGQLLVYRHSLSLTINRAFLVAPDYPSTEPSTFRAVLADRKLELLRFSDVRRGGYSFHDLTKIFA